MTSLKNSEPGRLSCDRLVSPAAGPGHASLQFRVALVTAGLIALAGILFNHDLQNDVASCYAPQVREFAVGNYETAFFHATPPLMIVLAGLLAKLGLPAFAALKTVSAAFFLGGLWPLARILRRMVPGPLVGWGCLLYALNSQLLRSSSSGLLDPVKMFFLLWLAERVLLHAEEGTPRWRTALWCGAAMAGLALARAEGIFFLPLFVAGLVLLPLFGRRGARSALRKTGHNLAMAAGATGLTVLLCLPQFLYIQHLTGVPALDSRQVDFLRRVAGGTPLATFLPTAWTTRPAGPVPAQATYGTPLLKPAYKVDRRWRNLGMVLRGLEPYLLVLAAVGCWRLWRRREWGDVDTVCVAIVFFNAAMLLSTGFVIKRYIMITIPFVVGWAVLGLAVLKCNFLDRWHAKAFPAVAVLCLALSGGIEAARTYRPETPLLEFGRWLQAHRGETISPTSVVLKNSVDSYDYHPGRQPIIAASHWQYAYWGAADAVDISDYSYSPEELRQFLRASQVDLLVVDASLLSVCPDLCPEKQPWLDKIGESTRPGKWAAYRIVGTKEL